MDLAGFSSVIFVSVFALYGIRMEAAWYPVLLSALFGIIMVVCGYIRHEKKHRGLKRVRLSGEILPRSARLYMLPPAGNLTEEDYQALLMKMEAAYREEKRRMGCVQERYE